MKCVICGEPCIAGMNICQKCLDEYEEKRAAMGVPAPVIPAHAVRPAAQPVKREEGVPLYKAVLAVVITLVLAAGITVFTLVRIGAWEVIVGGKGSSGQAELSRGSSENGLLGLVGGTEWYQLENGQFEVALTVGGDGEAVSERLRRTFMPEGGSMYFFDDGESAGLKFSGGGRELELPLGSGLEVNRIHMRLSDGVTDLTLFRLDTDLDPDLVSKVVGRWENGSTVFEFDPAEGGFGYYSGHWLDSSGNDPIEWVVAGDNLLVIFPSDGTVQAFAASSDGSTLTLSCYEPDGRGGMEWKEVQYSPSTADN